MGISVVVSDRCTGHGQCYSHCPEVFSPDEEGFAVVDQSAVAEHESGVRQAASICPERAIEITES